MTYLDLLFFLVDNSAFFSFNLPPRTFSLYNFFSPLLSEVAEAPAVELSDILVPILQQIPCIPLHNKSEIAVYTHDRMMEAWSCKLKFQSDRFDCSLCWNWSFSLATDHKPDSPMFSTWFERLLLNETSEEYPHR